jgi:hypothetical protein
LSEFSSPQRISVTKPARPTKRKSASRFGPIAKRGRKRWLGLVFVTQLPQHMPRQIFGGKADGVTTKKWTKVSLGVMDKQVARKMLRERHPN